MLCSQSRGRDPDKHLPSCYKYVPLKNVQCYLHVCCLIQLIFPSLFPPFLILKSAPLFLFLILFSPSLCLASNSRLSIYLFPLTDLSPWMFGQLLVIFELDNVQAKQREREMVTCLVRFSELSLKMRPDSRPFCPALSCSLLY